MWSQSIEIARRHIPLSQDTLQELSLYKDIADAYGVGYDCFETLRTVVGLVNAGYNVTIDQFMEAWCLSPKS